MLGRMTEIFFGRGQLFGADAPDQTPADETKAKLATEENVALCKKLIAELSKGALEARESPRIQGQPETGGVAPLEVVVLNREFPGLGERLLTTILIPLERKTDGSLSAGVMFPVTHKKVVALLKTLEPQLKEKQAEIKDATKARFGNLKKTKV